MFSISKNKDFCEPNLWLQKRTDGPGVEIEK